MQIGQTNDEECGGKGKAKLLPEIKNGGRRIAFAAIVFPMHE